MEAGPLVMEGESPVMEAGPPGDSEAGVLRAHPCFGPLSFYLSCIADQRE